MLDNQTNLKDSAKKKSTASLPSDSVKKRGRPSGKQISKSEMIRKYAVTFPDSKAAAIAKALGLERKFVQQILSQWKRKQKDVVLVNLGDLIDTKKHIDMVNHPPHYTQGGIETIDFIEAKKLSYNLGNVVKYITRSDLKGNKLEDLQKARWYLDREITRVTPPLP